MVFGLRFDMRAPAIGAPAADLYSAALEMAAWAESRGAVNVTVCEHHASDDGYCPSPMVLATALAARTTTLRITVAVVVLPLYDPIRLAEEMAVLDQISRGRVLYVAAIGYRPIEYEQFGIDFHQRGAMVEDKLALLLRAKSGEPFEHEGRRVHVTPQPFTPGGPMVAYGGGTVVAARRAGRHGVGFFAQRGGPELQEAYEQAARAAGHEPGFCYLPPPDLPTTTFVAHDVDRAWDELGPHMLYDAQAYAAWNEGDDTTSSLSFASNVEQLRAESRSHRIISVDEAIAEVRAGSMLGLQPLAGGLDPEVAWRYLRVVTDDVVPAVS